MGEDPVDRTGAPQRQAAGPNTRLILRCLDWLLIAALTIGGGIFAGTIIWLMAVR